MLKSISNYLSENPTIRYWVVRPEWVAVILLIISIISSIQLSPFFADLAFIMDSATPYVEYGLIAIILTLIIISGEIDLSIASMIALTAVIFGTAYNAGLGMPLSMLIAMFSGTLCGLFNGILVTKLQIPSIILTIGTLTLYRGIAQSLASDFSLGGYPSWFIGIDVCQHDDYTVTLHQSLYVEKLLEKFAPDHDVNGIKHAYPCNPDTFIKLGGPKDCLLYTSDAADE